MKEKLQRRPGVVSAEASGETVLVRESAGRFYGLGETGTAIWARLDQPCSTEELVTTVAEEYGLPEERVTADLCAFLDALRREELVEPAGAVSASAGPVRGDWIGQRGARLYEPPTLDGGTLSQAAGGTSGLW